MIVSYATIKKKVHFLKFVCKNPAVPLPKPPIEFTKERTTISLPAYVYNAVIALQGIKGTDVDFSGILQEAIIAYAKNHHPDLLDGIKSDIRSGKIKVSDPKPKKKPKKISGTVAKSRVVAKSRPDQDQGDSRKAG